MSFTSSAGFFLFAAAALSAQTSAPPALRFEVASVKPNRTLACRGRWDFNVWHGAVTAENAPLLRIVSRAFNLSDDRVSGPGWLDSQCYDIRAKAPAHALNRDIMPMLQTLLRERFHLAAQLQPGERPIFALVVDKGGSKLRPFGDPVPKPASANEGTVLFMARHLPDLCERLGKVTGRPVIDETGLTGDFQIELTYLPFGSLQSDPADPAADVFTAVRNQLGLKLEARRGMVDILKIDSVEKVPTGN